MSLFGGALGNRNKSGAFTAALSDKDDIIEEKDAVIAEQKQAIEELSDEVSRTRRAMNSISERVDGLESRADQQEVWNADCENAMPKKHPMAGLTCPGCGKPADQGMHGAICFTSRADTGKCSCNGTAKPGSRCVHCLHTYTANDD